MPKQNDPAEVTAEPTQEASCGLIMPISATSGHEKLHWDSMLELLTRAIEQAGYNAKPVWIDSSSDRVSERIIGNIFEQPVIVADITDLNPNVMFELGLRLASKKPTLVVMEDGGDIPFDIRDFHIHIYPKHLSILGMEKFIQKLSDDIKAKHKAFEGDDYSPFLSRVVVDVVSPNEREVTMNQFVLDQLNELNRRVAKLDRPSPRRSPTRGESPNDMISSTISSKTAAFYVTVNISDAEDFIEDAADLFDEVEELGRDDRSVYYALIEHKESSDMERSSLRRAVNNLLSKFKGSSHAPRYMTDRYSF